MTKCLWLSSAALLLLILILVMGPAGPALAGEAAGTVPTAATYTGLDRPLTGLQFAAARRMTYEDARTYVMLQSGHLRMRFYPGTFKAVVAGHEYTLKDRIVRNGTDVVLSARVVRFMNRQIDVFQAEEARRRSLAQAARTAQRKILPQRRPAGVTRVRRPEPAPPTPPTPLPAEPEHVPAAAGAWVPPTTERQWKWIVLHHSDDDSGSVAKYDRYHRYTKHWEHGCGYHFVIGNGTETRDGEVEMGPRWSQQLHGAHAKTPDNRYNEHGVGICLVGDFHHGSGRPSEAQMDSLVQLTRWLMARYDIPEANVQGHCDCCKTNCPGRNFPWADFRRRLVRRP